uniref:Uncharacterized protein n=1 Tax=Meloidogyne enterolobii TaxID=390850 RepID=A0A6V7X5N0_MELEN|nr:unnamed protein product [Meloidogyne enterolobii]
MNRNRIDILGNLLEQTENLGEQYRRSRRMQDTHASVTQLRSEIWRGIGDSIDIGFTNLNRGFENLYKRINEAAEPNQILVIFITICKFICQAVYPFK